MLLNVHERFPSFSKLILLIDGLAAHIVKHRYCMKSRKITDMKAKLNIQKSTFKTYISSRFSNSEKISQNIFWISNLVTSHRKFYTYVLVKYIIGLYCIISNLIGCTKNTLLKNIYALIYCNAVT